MLSFLPGLRDLRVPLVCGYLWLGTAFVFYYSHLDGSLSDQRQATGLWERIGDLFGDAALIATTTFTAWALGTAWMRLFGVVDAFIRRGDERALLQKVVGSETDVGEHDFARRWLTKLAFKSSTNSRVYLGSSVSEEPMTRVVERLAREDLVASLDQLQQIVREMSGGSSVDRLLEHNRDLFMEFDRHKSEGDFRINVAIPTSCLVVAVLDLLDSAAWLKVAVGGVAFGVLLIVYLEGLWRRRSGIDTVAYAVADGLIDTPTISMMLRERSRSGPSHGHPGYR